MRHPFGWCGAHQHGICKRAYVSTYGARKGEVRTCGCDEDGCPCAVMNHVVPGDSGVHADETVVQ